MQASHDAPAWMGGSKQPIQKPANHDEAVLRSENEHAFNESKDAPAWMGGQPLQKPPNHDEAVLRSENEHAFNETRMLPLGWEGANSPSRSLRIMMRPSSEARTSTPSMRARMLPLGWEGASNLSRRFQGTMRLF